MISSNVQHWEAVLSIYDENITDSVLSLATCCGYAESDARALCKLSLVVIRAFKQQFQNLANEPIFLVRCPGRVNLRGMHVDSHGGACNAVAIGPGIETLLLVCPTHNMKSSTFVLKNVDSEYEELVIDSEALPSFSRGWGRYIIGALAAMKEWFGEDTKMSGFTGLIYSTLPKGAGISSSHSLILSFIQGCLLANTHLRYRLSPVSLLELARAAEGKAGAVTGLSDQGALMLARVGHIVHACFYQNDLTSIHPVYLPWPRDYFLVVVDSLVRRDLAGAQALNYALPRFAYSIGLGLLKEVMKASGYEERIVERIDRLSRICPEELEGHGIRQGTAAIYKLLKAVPEEVTVEELDRRFPTLRPVVEVAEKNYLCKIPLECRPRRLHLRGPLLFGIAECARARKFASLFGSSSAHVAQPERDNGPPTEVSQSQLVPEWLRQAGRLMSVGHLGDSLRVGDFWRPEVDDPLVDFWGRAEVSDAYLDMLINRLTENPADELAQLEHQPGAFAASLPELDQIQRIMLSAGALGASLTGAGMGGVVVGLAHAAQLPSIRKSVQRHYFGQPHEHFDHTKAKQLAAAHIHICYPVAGLSVIRLSPEDGRFAPLG